MPLFHAGDGVRIRANHADRERPDQFHRERAEPRRSQRQGRPQHGSRAQSAARRAGREEETRAAVKTKIKLLCPAEVWQPKRGARPGNRNAWKTGYHCARMRNLRSRIHAFKAYAREAMRRAEALAWERSEEIAWKKNNPPLEGGSKNAKRFSGRGKCSTALTPPRNLLRCARKLSTLPQGEVGMLRRLRGARGDGAFDPLLDLGLRKRADLRRRDLAALEDHHRRDAAHAVFLRHVRILVDVDLGNRDLAFHLRRQFIQRRCDHLARAAPLRPEIDHDRALGVEDVVLEGRIGDFKRHGNTLGLKLTVNLGTRRAKINAPLNAPKSAPVPRPEAR